MPPGGKNAGYISSLHSENNPLGNETSPHRSGDDQIFSLVSLLKDDIHHFHLFRYLLTTFK